jgi:hypothetical protein
LPATTARCPGATPKHIGRHGARQHHTRAVVVAESDRPLDGAGGEHDPGRPDDAQIAPRQGRIGSREVVGDLLVEPDDIGVVEAESGGPGQYPDTLQRRDPLVQPRAGGFALDGPGRGQGRAAKRKILLDQHDVEAVARRQFRRGQSGRAGADDEQVAMVMNDVVAVRIGRTRGIAHAGGAADEFLEEHPLAGAAAEPDEGLVVEPRRQEPAEQIVHPANVEADIRPGVLAPRRQTLAQLDLGRLGVRLAPGAGADRDQGATFLRARRHDAARAVILEAAPQDALAVGHQGRGQGVARQSLHGAAIPGESQRPGAVDDAALAEPVAAHSRASAVG